MTKTNRPRNKKKQPPNIKDMAGEFDAEFNKLIKVTVLKNGAVGYDGFIIKQSVNQNWCLHRATNLKDTLGEFKLKTCALLAAKAYSTTSLNRYFEIKELDNQYWAKRADTIVYKNIIKKPVALDRYIIILNKLEESEVKEAFLKQKITTMFHSSFA